MPKSVYLIPSGPKNLKSLFPAIDFSTITEYFLEVQDDIDTVIATTPLFKSCNCLPEGGIRIHFLNYSSTYDAVNFLKPNVIHEDTADEFQKSLSVPLSKQDGGSERFNIRSNDTFQAKYKCTEDEMPWLQELADSPKMYLEWKGIEGQPDDYIPLTKIAGKFDKLKNTDEWDYQFILEFKLSNEYIALRN